MQSTAHSGHAHAHRYGQRQPLRASAQNGWRCRRSLNAGNDERTGAFAAQVFHALDSGSHPDVLSNLLPETMCVAAPARVQHV